MQGRVAFLPCLPVTLKTLKPKESDFEPRTLGQHIKHCRLTRNLTQDEAGRLLGIGADTILNWEKGHTKPPIESMRAVLQFLGYDPLPEPTNLSERLRATRRGMGWSIRKAAEQLGVDPGAWRDWEQGRVILYRKHRKLVAGLLGLPVEEVDQEMRGRWNRSHGKTRFSE